MRMNENRVLHLFPSRLCELFDLGQGHATGDREQLDRSHGEHLDRTIVNTAAGRQTGGQGFPQM